MDYGIQKREPLHPKPNILSPAAFVFLQPEGKDFWYEPGRNGFLRNNARGSTWQLHTGYTRRMLTRAMDPVRRRAYHHKDYAGRIKVEQRPEKKKTPPYTFTDLANDMFSRRMPSTTTSSTAWTT